MRVRVRVGLKHRLPVCGCEVDARLRACVPTSVGARMQVISRAAAHLAQGRPSLREWQQGRGDQAVSGADVRREQRPPRRLAAVKRQRDRSLGRRLREPRRPCTARAQAAHAPPWKRRARRARARGEAACGPGVAPRGAAQASCRGGAQGCSFGHAAGRAVRAPCAPEPPTRREAAAHGSRCAARLAVSSQAGRLAKCLEGT